MAGHQSSFFIFSVFLEFFQDMTCSEASFVRRGRSAYRLNMLVVVAFVLLLLSKTRRAHLGCWYGRDSAQHLVQQSEQCYSI